MSLSDEHAKRSPEEHLETSLADEHAKPASEVHECDICCSTQLCNSECARAVDGGWGDWGTWSQCSKTCDNGTQSRGRSCDSPTPAGGGTVCVGLNSQSRGCSELSCPAADCSDLLNSGRSWPSGVYRMVTWHTHKRFNVFCDMDTDGGGWTVFQYRFNGSVDFYKNLHNYEAGFGSLHGEFWLSKEILNTCKASVLLQYHTLFH
ncbi:fibrinogen C domain-containing protein 1-like [Mya arenaria]|uniref:fibrinogen C domain-containing protein 1-like n=1 Tax=Mya arenaria TaxID=6604 RepID=UPI0022DEE850|nr:fibrinogen C domain-containing protein 1-like [Mya arenaria]